MTRLPIRPIVGSPEHRSARMAERDVIARCNGRASAESLDAQRYVPATRNAWFATSAAGGSVGQCRPTGVRPHACCREPASAAFFPLSNGSGTPAAAR